MPPATGAWGHHLCLAQAFVKGGFDPLLLDRFLTFDASGVDLEGARRVEMNADRPLRG
jgi:hypothetical protein